MEAKKRILLCEDEESLGMLLREYLQAKDYDAVLCPDGERGYSAFIKEHFDLCLLDVMMPKMDGFTLAKEIRKVNQYVCYTYYWIPWFVMLSIKSGNEIKTKHLFYLNPQVKENRK